MHIERDCEKLNVIIYGLGQRFQNDFFQEFLLKKIQSMYCIIAVSDKQEPPNEVRVKLNWTFVNRKKIGETKYDLILITSKIYYEEIRKELVEDYQLNGNRIISTDVLLKNIYNCSIHTNLFKNMSGIEIGGPTEFFSDNIYNVCATCDGVNFSTNTEWWKKVNNDYCFENKKLGQIFISDATKLVNIPDNKYDFCVSSNNLEHVANPLKALSEFKRILKVEGILLIIVPMKSKCFDHDREFTSFEHILEDYRIDVKEDDLSHLSEILEKHDYKMDIPCGGKKKFYLRSQNNFENRCLHHHVFSVFVLEKMFNYLEIEVIESGDLAYNYFILGKKR